MAQVIKRVEGFSNLGTMTARGNHIKKPNLKKT